MKWRYTDLAYLQAGDAVQIVEALDADPALIGQQATLSHVSPLTHQAVVRLMDGRDVTVTKLRHIRDDAVVRKPRSRPLPRALVRFIFDYKAQHEQLTMRDLATIFHSTEGVLARWQTELRKDARAFPPYSQRQAEAWSRQFLAERPEADGDDAAAAADDGIAVECLERRYALTDGDVLLTATIGRDHLTAELRDRNGEEHVLLLTHEVARSFAKLLDGAARLAQKEYQHKEES